MDNVVLHVTQRRSSLTANDSAENDWAYLVYHTSFGKPMNFILANQETRIGRKEDNDIVLSCVKISKYHAVVIKNEFGYWIKDLHSSNGIRVNNTLVDPQQPYFLTEGDELQIGSITLYFHDEQNDYIASLANQRNSINIDLPAEKNVGGYAEKGFNLTESPMLKVPQPKQQPALSRRSSEGSVSIASSTSSKLSSKERGLTLGQIDSQTASNGWGQPSASISPFQAKSEARMSQLMAKAAALSIGKGDSANRNSSLFNENVLKLVTILPSDRKYEDNMTIAGNVECEEEMELDFEKVDLVNDTNVLRDDYEKLRLAYELTKVSQSTDDVSLLLERTLELIFDIIPVSRGVVLLVDNMTGLLATHSVKIRPGRGNEDKEILVSSTIVKRVFSTKSGLVTSDTFEDPMLGRSCSIRAGQIRSVICLPLLAHGKCLGILHLDAHDSISAFSASKELTLIKVIASQTALAIENTLLLREVQLKAQMTQQLRRFLAPHIVDRMTGKNEMIRRGGREIQGTIVFADIRGFTNLSERSAPNEVVELLNDYFERLVKIVFKYDGTIDKYIGDALMATFGTLDAEDTSDAEFRAAAACLEFLSAIKELNLIRSRANPPKQPIEIGVGVNTGPCVAGFIGAAQRLEYTCIGDTVNTSSRISGMAGGNQVLISETTFERIKGRVEAEFVGSQQFKGKDKEVNVYQLLSLNEKPPANRATVNYGAGRMSGRYSLLDYTQNF